MDKVKDNLDHARKQLNKACLDPKTRQGLAKGFEYATQKDGSVLGERMWRDLRRRAHTCFHLYKPESTNNRSYNQSHSSSSVSLQRIQRMAETHAQQYQRQQSLPPEPPKISPPSRASVQQSTPALQTSINTIQSSNLNDSIISIDSVSPVNSSNQHSTPNFLSPTRRAFGIDTTPSTDSFRQHKTHLDTLRKCLEPNLCNGKSVSDVKQFCRLNPKTIGPSSKRKKRTLIHY